MLKDRANDILTYLDAMIYQLSRQSTGNPQIIYVLCIEIDPGAL